MFKLFPDNTDMRATVNGNTIDVRDYKGFSGRLSWSNTGTPVGIFRLQVSMDGTNWEDRTDTDTGFTAVPGGAGTPTASTFNFIDLGWWFVRVRYIRTSGGSAQSTLSGIGAVKA